ncbi:unnamed protein product, partial [Vitis vinifera]
MRLHTNHGLVLMGINFMPLYYCYCDCWICQGCKASH